GQQAAASYTGALAGSDAVFDAVFARAGVWRVRSVEALISLGHAAVVLGSERMPAGKRVAVLTASGGFGVMMADAASAVGLILPELSPVAQAKIVQAVPYASPRNPVDATAEMSSRPAILGQVLAAVLEDEGCDALMVQMSTALYLPRLRSVYMEALRMVRERFPSRVVMLCVRGPEDALRELNALGFPTADSIDMCCATLAGLAGLAARSGRPPVAIDVPKGKPLPADAFRHEAGAKRVLAAAGVPVLPERLAQSAAAAAGAAAELGFPVVLKIASPDLPHKTEV